MIVADANFVIALLKPNDIHHSWASDVFEAAGGDPIGISALNLAESLVHPYASGVGVEFEEDLAELEIEVFGILPEHATDLAKLRAETGLRMPDSVALDAALRCGGRLCTADARLAKVARERGLTVFSPTGA